MEITVFQFLGQSITNAIDAFLLPSIGRLMLSLQGFALTAVTIYIFLMGASIVFGTVQAPVSKFVIQGLKITLITTLALTVDAYYSYIVETMRGLEVGLANALGAGGEDPANIYVVLDSVLGRAAELMNDCFRRADDAGLLNPGSWAGWLFVGGSVALGTVLVGVIGGAAIVVAKFALALMFALGPFFVLMLMFPLTSRFFDSWFSQVMNYTILIVIAAVIMTFSVAAFSAYVDAADVSGGGEVNPIAVGLGVLALAVLLGFVIYQIYGMAAGLAGGISMSALTLTHLATPGRAVGRMVNPVSTRRDLESGMMTTAKRLNHLTAGNTLANPAYAQHVYKQIGKNYGWTKGGKAKQDVS